MKPTAISHLGFLILQFALIIVTENKFNINFSQNEYHLMVERVEMKDCNKNYMNIASIASFKYNRTAIAMNCTLNYKIDVGDKLEVILQGYKFASNEYRLFPMRFGGYLCDFIKADVGGMKSITKVGNFTGCPFKKNLTYHFGNFIPDDSKLPPYLPKGRYMGELSFMYNSIELYSAKIYTVIVYPEIKGW